jgi:hypothetical protein
VAPRPVDVDIRSRGVDGVRRDFRLIGSEAEELTEKGGRAARGISGAFLEIAHSGEIGVRSLKDFAREGAEIVTMFGTGGPILGAIALVGLAFFEAFERGRKEMEKTRRAALEELQKIAEGGDLIAAGKVAQRLYSGDPYALMAPKNEGESDEAYYGRAFGITGLQNTIGLNRAEIERLKAHSTPGGENQIVRLTLANERLNKVLDEQNAKHAIAIMLVEQFAAKAGEIAANQLANQHYGVGGDEVPVIGNLGALESLFGISHEDAGHQKGVRGFGLLPKDAYEVKMDKLHVRADTIPPDLFNSTQLELLKQWDATMHAMQDTMVGGIAGTLSTALSDAFTGSFDQLGKDAEAGIGSIISNMGGILIHWGTAILPLASLFTKDPLTAGLEAISIGVLLEGLGKALGKAAQGHSGGYSGGGGGFSASSAYATQQSIAGQGRATVVFKGRKHVYDMSNPDDRTEWIANLRALFGDRQIDFIFDDA